MIFGLLAPDELLFYAARAFDEIKLPLMSALLGWALGSLAGAILNHRSIAVETAPR